MARNRAQTGLRATLSERKLDSLRTGKASSVVMPGARIIPLSVLLDIADRYIRGETSLAAEARKHGVSASYLYQHSQRGGWEQKSREYKAKKLNAAVASVPGENGQQTIVIQQPAQAEQPLVQLSATVPLVGHDGKQVAAWRKAVERWHIQGAEDMEAVKVKALGCMKRAKGAEKVRKWEDIYRIADEIQRGKLLIPLPGTITYGQAGAAGNRGRGRRVMGSGDLSVDLPAEQPATSEQPAEAPVRPVSEQGQSAGPGLQAGAEAVGPAGAVEPKVVADQRPLEAGQSHAGEAASEFDPESREDWPAED